MQSRLGPYSVAYCDTCVCDVGHSTGLPAMHMPYPKNLVSQFIRWPHACEEMDNGGGRKK